MGALGALGLKALRGMAAGSVLDMGRDPTVAPYHPQSSLGRGVSGMLSSLKGIHIMELGLRRASHPTLPNMPRHVMNSSRELRPWLSPLSGPASWNPLSSPALQLCVGAVGPLVNAG